MAIIFPEKELRRLSATYSTEINITYKIYKPNLKCVFSVKSHSFATGIQSRTWKSQTCSKLWNYSVIVDFSLICVTFHHSAYSWWVNCTFDSSLHQLLLRWKFNSIMRFDFTVSSMFFFKQAYKKSTIEPLQLKSGCRPCALRRSQLLQAAPSSRTKASVFQ